MYCLYKNKIKKTIRKQKYTKNIMKFQKEYFIKNKI